MPCIVIPTFLILLLLGLVKDTCDMYFSLTYIGPLWHHNRVFKLACTCASLTPAPRFQGSSSLCPSPFNCITRNIKRHLPYSPFFLSIFPSFSLSLYPEPLLFTLCSFLISFFHSSFLLPLFFPFFTLLSFFHSSFLLLLFFSFLLSFFHSSFFYYSFLNFCISCTGISFRKCIF